ncbi:MAG: hypothetical protein ACI4PH_11350 [Faecousia sp.]
MKKYQVITYSEETGADERLEFSRKREADAYAKAQLYTNPRTYGTSQGAIVWNLKDHCIVSVFGYFPEEARPAWRK